MWSESSPSFGWSLTVPTAHRLLTAALLGAALLLQPRPTTTRAEAHQHDHINPSIGLEAGANLTQAEQGFGVGQDPNPEVGINLAELEQAKRDIVAGLYDRPCTADEHDPTRWHSLVNQRARCHYDHHHGDDPNYVSDIFSEPGAWFGSAGQSISYPWQTFVIPPGHDQSYVNRDPSQQENGYKHEGYAWVVRRNQECPSRAPDTSGNAFVRSMGACVTDFRVQYHFHGMMDAAVRYHSTSVEMRLCLEKTDASSCGLYRTGGWMDFGRLFTTDPDNLRCDHDVNEQFIPLPDETRFGPFDRVYARDEVRCHPKLGSLGALPSSTVPTAEWWGHIMAEPGQTRYQLRIYDVLGNIDAANPSQFKYFCSPADSGCRFTNSVTSMFMGYTQAINVGLGEAKHVAYITRWGDRASGCQAASVDCIPVTLENVQPNLDYNRDGKPEEARYFHTVCETCPRVDHNISPPGQQWITWFYRHASH